MSGARATGRIGRRSFVVTLGVAVVLTATSCNLGPKWAPGDELGSALESDGVLPEGAAWRSSSASRTVCIFGVTDVAEQDRIVEAALESVGRVDGELKRKNLSLEFWSGDPPPRDVPIRNKPAAYPGMPNKPTEDAAGLNAPYEIRRIRTVKLL